MKTVALQLLEIGFVKGYKYEHFSKGAYNPNKKTWDFDHRCQNCGKAKYE